MQEQFEVGSRSRRAREGGWMGRKRWYKCRVCNARFLVDTGKPLAKSERLCQKCRGNDEQPTVGRI